MAQVEDHVERTIAAYNQAAEAYARDNAEKLGPAEEHLKRFAKLVPVKNVFEIGFGLGNDAKWLTEHGFTYSGMDAARHYRTRLSEILEPDQREAIFSGDIRRVVLPFAKYGGIWAMASLVYFDNHDLLDIFKNCHQALQPNGVFYTSLMTGQEEVRRSDGVTLVMHTVDEVLKLADNCQFSLIDKLAGLPNPSFPTKRNNWMSYYFRKA